MKKNIVLIISIFYCFSSFAQTDSLFQNWTFGASKGFAQIAGEVDSKSGFAFGFFTEKHIHPVFSVKLNLEMGSMQGQNEASSTNWLNHPIWNGKTNSAINYNNALTSSVYANFETNYMEGNLQGVFTFSQLPMLKNKSSFDGFLLAGIGGMRYESKIDAADENGAIYDFSKVGLLDSEGENRTTENLNSLLDGNFETAFSENPQTTLLYQVGVGVKWKLKNNITLTLSHRVSFAAADDLDAHQWNENNELDTQNDIQHFTSLSVSYTLFKKKKPKPALVIVDATPSLPMLKFEIPISIEIVKLDLETVYVKSEEVPEEVETVELTVEEKEVVKQAFDNLEFETSRDVISNESFNSLNELAALLTNHPTWKLRINGHTDNVGKPANNMDLSKRRAEAVRDYLANRGIGYERFLVAWYGEEQPIADNKTKAGRQKNRRVEMEIVE